MLDRNHARPADEDSVILSCRVPKELKDALGEIAESEFSSVSAVARMGIASHIAQRRAQLAGTR